MIPALALPALLALIAMILAANSLRILWIGLRLRHPKLDDVFFNASAAFMFFTLTLVFAQ